MHLFNWPAHTSTQTPKYSRKTDKSKMLCFKFQENRTINEEFDILRGEGGSGTKESPFIDFNFNCYWQTYEKVLFQISAKSYRKINEEFEFFEGEGEGPLAVKGAPIHKFIYQILLVNI